MFNANPIRVSSKMKQHTKPSLVCTHTNILRVKNTNEIKTNGTFKTIRIQNGIHKQENQSNSNKTSSSEQYKEQTDLQSGGASAVRIVLKSVHQFPGHCERRKSRKSPEDVVFVLWRKRLRT